MYNHIGESLQNLLLASALIIPVLSIAAMTRNWSLLPPPKERDFGPALADWARRRGLSYAPQKGYVISGVYHNRWFAIRTTNEENALQIQMSVQNPRRTRLQIFGDWLEDSGVTAFVSRFRIYGNPSGVGEILFDGDTGLRDALMRLPGVPARIDVYSDPKHLNRLRYSLLADLPGADTLETIMASLCSFCDMFERETAQAPIAAA